MHTSMQSAGSAPASDRRWLAFVVLAVAGLAYVKWMPYVHKAELAASTHSVGTSILQGQAASAPAPSLQAALDYAWAYGNAIWKAMVLGLALGAAVQVLLPRAWILRVLGDGRVGGVLAASILSIPGMMCTCCAAPVVAGLRSCRAAQGPAVAFWLGNTMLNPATLVFMGFVLGWQWSALRLALGLCMVLGLGWLVGRMTATQAAGVDLPEPDADAAPGRSLPVRWLVLFARMALRLLPETVLLVLLLGAARAWLFPHLGPEVGNDVLWILAFAAAGALFVIPTAGEIPIVQSLLALGVGVGPAVALLVTLPPVSAPSMAMLWRSFEPRVMVTVVGAIVALGVAGGLLATALGL